MFRKQSIKTLVFLFKNITKYSLSYILVFLAFGLLNAISNSFQLFGSIDGIALIISRFADLLDSQLKIISENISNIWGSVFSTKIDLSGEKFSLFFNWLIRIINTILNNFVEELFAITIIISVLYSLVKTYRVLTVNFELKENNNEVNANNCLLINSFTKSSFALKCHLTC